METMNIEASGINSAFVSILQGLSGSGKESAPRRQKIKELLNVSVKIENPKKRILSLPFRKISLPFAFGELLWYLTGRNDVETMEYYSRRMKTFSDDGLTLNSAYGYRMFGEHPMLPFNQWEFVINKLREDRDSRQAVIHLHTPNNEKTKDEVCTLGFQFLIRNNKLDMVVNMRSNDIIWGFTYDVFSFTTFQELIANELGVETGSYYHNAASMHVYEKDFKYLDIVDEIGPELQYMTKYDTEFSLNGAILNDNDFKQLIDSEFNYRAGVDQRKHDIKNDTIEAMRNVFWLYSIFKRNGKEETLKHLKYDNLLHTIMREYISRTKPNESSLLIVDGPDGSGKSTYINEINKDKDFDVIHFDKPKDFDKQLYFHTALLTGNIILDRFYISEWIYSSHFGRNSKINRHDIDVIEKLLNYRDANYMFMNTDDYACYERLDESDKEIFSREDLETLCMRYDINYNASRIFNKQKYSERIVR